MNERISNYLLEGTELYIDEDSLTIEQLYNVLNYMHLKHIGKIYIHTNAEVHEPGQN